MQVNFSNLVAFFPTHSIHQRDKKEATTTMENATAAIDSTGIASNTTTLHSALYETTQDVLVGGGMIMIFIIGLFIHGIITWATLALGEKISPKGECSIVKALGLGTALLGGFCIYAFLTLTYGEAFEKAGSPSWLAMTMGAAIALGIQTGLMAIGLVLATCLALVFPEKADLKDEGQSFLEQGAWPKGAEVDYDEEERQTCDKFDRRASF